MKLAIITSGYLPVPATKGGAVEKLVENFIKENEIKRKIEIIAFSVYDEKAKLISKKYKHANIKYINIPKVVDFVDKIIFFIAKNILRKNKSMSYRYICQRLYYLNQVSKDLKKNEYDKILLENHSTLFLALKWRKNYKKYKERYYYHIHNEINSNYGCKKIIMQSKKIICVSNYIVDRTKLHFKMNDATGKYTVLKNCIDEDEFLCNIDEKDLNKIRKKYGIKESDKILLFTGRLTEEKGIKELLLSIKNIRCSHFKLLIVGSFFFDTGIKNKFEIELSDIIEDINNKVIFTGFVNYKDIPILYKIADIAVLPSIWDDPAPLTIIESLKSGLPIITTHSGGIPEYVNDECAIILDKIDKGKLVKELSENIEKLLANSNKLKKMSKKSLEISKDLTLENYYINLLEKLN